MSVLLPATGIKTPTETTELRLLGRELREFGETVDRAISTRAAIQDTGWRVVTDWLDPESWHTKPSALHVRRRGDTVFYRIVGAGGVAIIDPDTWGGFPLFGPPSGVSGFTPVAATTLISSIGFTPNTKPYWLEADTAGGVMALSAVLPDGKIGKPGVGSAMTHSVDGVLSYPTTADFPTKLPGVAA
ncbi:MAG: hypothetical protein ACTJGT_01760 [Microbacteriaceae bacterium]